MKKITTVFLIFLCIQAYGQQKKFDLNDPRNPDCPCHKIQRLADKEFAENTNVASDKRKKRIRWGSFTDSFTDLRFRFHRKLIATKRKGSDLSVCYKW